MRVKICGITNIEDALEACRLGADALGFIFYEKSRRFITPGAAAEIIRELPFMVVKTGVFVNESIENIHTIARGCGLNGVQLHGEESPEFVQQIQYPVLKGFRIGPEFNFDRIKEYSTCSLLFDTYSPAAYGGTGTRFDWQIIPPELRQGVTVAGGISPHNVDQLFREINPAAVDISSALESSPGKKDLQKMRAFFERIYKLKGIEC